MTLLVERLYTMSQPEQSESDNVVTDWPPYCKPNYRMPDVITVRINEKTGPREILVQVEKGQSKKSYIGGYRSKLTNDEFHHANTQTIETYNQNLPKNTSNLLTRESQTVDTVARSQQTVREYGTQMERSHICLDNSSDRILIAREYISGAQFQEKRLHATVICQRYWRGYCGRKKVWLTRELLDNRQTRIVRDQNAAATVSRLKNEESLLKRLNPDSFNDFSELYNDLSAWRQDQANTDTTHDINTKKDLLEKEVAILQTIDRMRQTSLQSHKADDNENLFLFMSQQKRWQSRTGEEILVDTQSTIKAREIYTLYMGLRNFDADDNDRIDVLTHIQWTVSQHNDNLTRDISSLIDREIDLISRKRHSDSLEGLRRRLLNLFCDFGKNPIYNNEAENFIPKISLLAAKSIAGDQGAKKVMVVKHDASQGTTSQSNEHESTIEASTQSSNRQRHPISRRKMIIGKDNMAPKMAVMSSTSKW